MIAFIQDMVRRMKPGDEAQFARELLMFPVPPPWKPAEWVLEGIVGSAYEFSVRYDERTGNAIFRRWQEPLPPESGCRHYVSADRKHLFTEYRPGYFISIGELEEKAVALHEENLK